MPMMLLALPLSSSDLRALAEEGYSIVDQAARTPGLLIAQAPEALSHLVKHPEHEHEHEHAGIRAPDGTGQSAPAGRACAKDKDKDKDAAPRAPLDGRGALARGA